MSVYIALVIAFVVSYLIGNINFARIFSWAFAKKDITTVGSKNPGTMNMLRTRGFGEAILTLVMEAIKCGVPALVSYYLIGHFYTGYADLAFFIAGFAAIVGHCFPVFYKFKGGKGVACTFGLFTFHPVFWWMSLIGFVICFLLLLFVVKFGSVVSLFYVTGMSVVATVLFSTSYHPFLIALLVIIWLNVIMIYALHHANLHRLFTGKENKVDLMSKLKKKKKSDQNLEVNDEENQNNDSVEEKVENTNQIEERTDENLKNDNNKDAN